MSILRWFKEVTSGSATADLIEQPLVFIDGEQEFHGLDIKDALDAHTAWTQRLERIIAGNSDEDLNVYAIARVASDCECKLGQWIHGEAARQFGDEAVLNELRHEHADFHLKAGEILNNIFSGEQDDANANLKKLRYQSGIVQLALVRLYSHSKL